MEHCQSLKVLSLKRLEIDENHCRVLGTYSRLDLEIVLILCKITSAGASALVEVLRRNHGSTKVNSRQIDNLVLADGLRGKCRLKSLTQRISNNVEVGNREILAGALRENKGLVELDLSYNLGWNDDTWVGHSLSKYESVPAAPSYHPTNTGDCVPCQGAGTSPSVSSNRCK
jgi:hypothetical protein